MTIAEMEPGTVIFVGLIALIVACGVAVWARDWWQRPILKRLDEIARALRGPRP